MPGPSASSPQNGKELALARRRAMSLTGGRSLPPKASPAVSPGPQTARPDVTALRAPSSTSGAGAASAALDARAYARMRRALLAGGSAPAPAGRSMVPTPPAATAGLAVPAPEPETSPAMAEGALDAVCGLIAAQPDAPGIDASVRALCRQRRRNLSSQGKAALGAQATAAAPRRALAPLATGRDLARQRRTDLSANGRGAEPPSRPSGRVRPAPDKVEFGTTLAGSTVTGTQVERTPRVTGNEAGSCRAITGTEYVGAEQFEAFCAARPEPAAPKVGFSATSRGQPVTGVRVGPAVRVSGDEAGTCRSVTGTEYLGSEAFADFCENRGLLERPAKVAVGSTARRQVAVTGADEARAAAVTGTEPGARRQITGSQYAEAGAARLTLNGAPSKVALTHTLAGRPVSGTEIGRSVKVTGDEAGACRAVSGTEYLSNEQFRSICHTRPDPAPAKVAEDASRGGQRVTGNPAALSPRVTGNEPGARQRVTGSQYASELDRDGAGAAWAMGPQKVATQHTLAGRALTGTAVGHGPQLSGDEHGGCLPVTGTEYLGREQYASCAAGTPAPGPAKVGASRTATGQRVSGAMLGAGRRVTGSEPGSEWPVSGTPYAGAEQASGCTCGGACGCGGGCGCGTKGRERTSPRYLPASEETPPAAEPAPRPADFSIVSPARAARSRITGSAYGGTGRITGPGNLAAGLVSGTPEFRYRDDAPAAVSGDLPPAPPRRVTGEGREGGLRITGDDWTRGGRVTGTEGHWAQGRTPSQRGGARAAQVGARANKDRERPPETPPPLLVTGSSGNTSKGPAVTYSGGARG